MFFNDECKTQIHLYQMISKHLHRVSVYTRITVHKILEADYIMRDLHVV
jgi:hypothetical protein